MGKPSACPVGHGVWVWLGGTHIADGLDVKKSSACCWVLRRHPVGLVPGWVLVSAAPGVSCLTRACVRGGGKVFWGVVVC